MAYSDEVRDEAVRQVKEDKKSYRAVGRDLGGVSPATIKAWVETAPDREAREGPVGVDEEEVTNLLLKKARALLVGVDNWSESKAQLEVASAVDKLLGKYLSLTGQAAESHVTVDSDPALVAWAQKFVKGAGASEA